MYNNFIILLAFIVAALVITTIASIPPPVFRPQCTRIMAARNKRQGTTSAKEQVAGNSAAVVPLALLRFKNSERLFYIACSFCCGVRMDLTLAALAYLNHIPCINCRPLTGGWALVCLQWAVPCAHARVIRYQQCRACALSLTLLLVGVVKFRLVLFFPVVRRKLVRLLLLLCMCTFLLLS